MDGVDSTAGIIAVAAAAVALVALVTAALAHVRMRRLRADQRAVLGDLGETDLVSHAAATGSQVDELRAGIDQIASALHGRMADAERRLDSTVSRSGVLRYDAFNESTGRQSSSVALLNDRGDGVVISAILQREQARVYCKPIHGGHSELELSPEERKAMRIAVENGAG